MQGRQGLVHVTQAEAFLAVADELHFGRAAERLNLAQPPLSRLIKQLEKDVAAQLFTRSTRHVELTYAGRALIEPARRLVAAAQDAHRAVQEAQAGDSGRVSVGFAGASVHRSIGELARQVRLTSPRLHLDFHGSQFSHNGLERVLDGSLDLAIGRWDFIPHEVDSRVLRREEVIVALPVKHRLAGQASIRMKQLAQDSWISLPSGFGSALPNRLTRLAQDAGFVPRITQTAPDSWTLVVLVGAGMGCAVTLDSVRDNVTADGVVFKAIDGNNPPLEVRAIWRRDNDNPGLRTVIKAAEGVLRSSVAPPSEPGGESSR
ncbi:LysR family transcriptional regulator [Nesterenkonia sp. CF4.4]|uniref:LysR family transcriptional regulator n=1 Tax=Nesterenkonia sp. CF4.4 TaxID=3373079 RepID=UPI003EE4EF32